MLTGGQIIAICLGAAGFFTFYSGYLNLVALDDEERAEIQEKLKDLPPGIHRDLRAYALINPKIGTRLLARWRARPVARRRIYIGAAFILIALVVVEVW